MIVGFPILNSICHFTVRSYKVSLFVLKNTSILIYFSPDHYFVRKLTDVTAADASIQIVRVNDKQQ